MEEFENMNLTSTDMDFTASSDDTNSSLVAGVVIGVILFLLVAIALAATAVIIIVIIMRRRRRGKGLVARDSSDGQVLKQPVQYKPKPSQPAPPLAQESVEVAANPAYGNNDGFLGDYSVATHPEGEDEMYTEIPEKLVRESMQPADRTKQDTAKPDFAARKESNAEFFGKMDHTMDTQLERKGDNGQPQQHTREPEKADLVGHEKSHAYVNDMEEFTREVQKAKLSGIAVQTGQTGQTSSTETKAHNQQGSKVKHQEEDDASEEDEEGYILYNPKRDAHSPISKGGTKQSNRGHSPANKSSDAHQQASIDTRPYVNDLDTLLGKGGSKLQEEGQGGPLPDSSVDTSIYVNDLSSLVGEGGSQLREREVQTCSPSDPPVDTSIYVNDLDALLGEGGGSRLQEREERGSSGKRRNPYVNDLAELMQQALGEDQERESERGLQTQDEAAATHNYVNNLPALLAQANPS